MFKIVEVKDKEMLESLVKDSALTWEGMTTDDRNLEEIRLWITKYTALKKEEIYVTKGIVMNEVYNLRGNNRYKDDLNIVSIKLSDMENPKAIVLPRLMVGGRWMDDIVANNEMHNH